MMECEFPTTHRPCSQAAYRGHRLCYYHEKLADGLLKPIEAYLTAGEIQTVLVGRRRLDGRRLDTYVVTRQEGRRQVDDPVELDWLQKTEGEVA